MQQAQQPTLVPLAFGASAPGGNITAPPLASQIGVVNGRASLTDGFPPLCFVPVSSGGVAPFGADFNGVLNLLAQHARMASAGAAYIYSAAFAVLPQVGGYPRGAQVLDGTTGRRWLNSVDGNMSDPAGFAASASFTGGAANGGTTAVLTVPGAPTGVISAGQMLGGAGVPTGTYVTAQLTGTPGAAGTYQLSQPTGTIASEAMTTSAAGWILAHPLALSTLRAAAAQTFGLASAGTTYFQTAGGILQPLPSALTMPEGIEFVVFNEDNGGTLGVSSADGFVGVASPVPVNGLGASARFKLNKGINKWMVF